MFSGSPSITAKKLGGDRSSDIQLAFPPNDAVSSLVWSPVANHLAVASWDNKVRVYDVPENSVGTGLAVMEFRGPVLSCDWSQEGRLVAGAGTDNTVCVLDLGTNGFPAQQVGAHDAPIRSVRFLNVPSTREQLLVTGSWDKTVKYWDLRSPNPAGTLSVHEKVYSMDSKDNTLVIATAERKLHVVDLTNPTKIFKSPECPLRHQIRVVTCFPDGLGFAVGGIEGRVGIIWNSEANSRKNYSFKYPRPLPATSMPSGIANVYGVNAISFYPTFKNIFSTAGSDGSFHFWDRDAHTRVKLFESVGQAIGATTFSGDGKCFAYSVGYDWSKGFAFNKEGGENRVMLHRVRQDEVVPARIVRKT